MVWLVSVPTAPAIFALWFVPPLLRVPDRY